MTQVHLKAFLFFNPLSQVVFEIFFHAVFLSKTLYFLGVLGVFFFWWGGHICGLWKFLGQGSNPTTTVTMSDP